MQPRANDKVLTPLSRFSLYKVEDLDRHFALLISQLRPNPRHLPFNNGAYAREDFITKRDSSR